MLFDESMQFISPTKNAEEKLIAPLIDYYGRDNPIVQRLLASYPGTSFYNKTAAISGLVKHLFQDFPAMHDLYVVFALQEKFLKAVGKRDHFTHQFEVFLLGWNIFQLYDRHQVLEFTPLKGISFREVSHLWMLTALGHDLGMPVTEISTILQGIGELYSDAALNEIIGDYNCYLSSIQRVGKEPLFWSKLCAV